MNKLYETNKSFKHYVDMYSKHRGISKEVALTHAMIRGVAKYYQEKSADVITTQADRLNCDSR